MFTEHFIENIMDTFEAGIVLIFLDITPCSWLKVSLSFGGKYRLHFQDRRISQTRYQQIASTAIGLPKFRIV
jgi:hypothetical protein